MKSAQHQVDSLLTTAAIASLLGAGTTAVLLFMSSPTATTFQEEVLLSGDGRYLFKLWVLFFHPQVNFIAALGAAFVLWRKHPVWITLGSFFLLIWCLGEMAQQAFLIDGLNQYWRSGFIQAEDEATQTMYRTLIEGSKGWSDSYYFQILYGFGLGSFFFGLAFLRQGALANVIGIILLSIALVSLCSFMRYYLPGLTALSSMIDGFYAVLYPVLQPLVRVLLCLWLLRKRRNMVLA
ncbi:MAG: hypothetical protein KTR24_05120 [Saprospiraceae bacterium]|nr:hypothetical protein [Saprospiraceae bacterium]